MNKKILELLFNYKKGLSRREFVMGNTILWFTFMLLFSTFAFEGMMLYLSSIGKEATPYIVANKQVTGYVLRLFNPVFVPFQFIINCCAFIVAYKRAKTIFKTSGLAIISGIINWVFFPALYGFVLSSFNLFSKEAYIVENVSGLNKALLLPIFIGGINMVYLWFGGNKQEDADVVASFPTGYTCQKYILKTGTLIAIQLGLGVLLTIFAIVLSDSLYLNHWLVITAFITVSITAFILFCFQFYYVIKRCINIGISIAWVIPAFILFLVLNLLFMYLIYHGLYVQMSNYAASFLYAIILAALYLMFFINPGKKPENLYK